MKQDLGSSIGQYAGQALTGQIEGTLQEIIVSYVNQRIEAVVNEGN